MSHHTDRLTAVLVAKVKQPGMYLDGAGLFLQVTGDAEGNVAKSWVFRFKLQGRQRDMGLGSYLTVTLAEARQKANDARKLKEQGIDPIEARKAEKTAKKLEEIAGVTFEECAKAYVEAHKAGWKNSKHIDQWSSTLQTYAYPKIGAKPVAQIDTNDVLDVLQPIWTRVTETAVRLRGRIEAILDWAKVKGHRKGDNPAVWKGHMDKLLPKPSKVSKTKHHPALPYNEMYAFLQKLRKEKGIPARALEYVILTVSRTTETRLAEWPEINAKEDVWTVPEGRMKGDREHRVPLTSQASAVLKAQRQDTKKSATLIFPGPKAGKPLSENAMLALLSRMGYGHVTVHGFRSSFRDWAADCTNYPKEVAEVALAHVNDDETEAAYLRSDLFEKRRALMNDWAKFCFTAPKATKLKAVNHEENKAA